MLALPVGEFIRPPRCNLSSRANEFAPTPWAEFIRPPRRNLLSRANELAPAYVTIHWLHVMTETQAASKVQKRSATEPNSRVN